MEVKTNTTVILRYNLKWSDGTNVDLRKQQSLSFVLTLPNDTTVTINDLGYDRMNNQIWVRIDGSHLSTNGNYKGSLSVMTKDLQMVTTGIVDLFEVSANGSDRITTLGLAVTVIDTPINQGQGYSPKIVDGVWFVFDDSKQTYVSTGQTVLPETQIEAINNNISDCKKLLDRRATINIVNDSVKIKSSPKSRNGYVSIPRSAVFRLGDNKSFLMESYFTEAVKIDTTNAGESNMKITVTYNKESGNPPVFELRRTNETMRENEYVVFQIRNSSGSLDIDRDRYLIEGVDFVESETINKSENHNAGFTLFDKLNVVEGETYIFYVKSSENVQFEKAWINLSLSAATEGSVYLTPDELYNGKVISFKPRNTVNNIRLYMSMKNGINGIKVETKTVTNYSIDGLALKNLYGLQKSEAKELSGDYVGEKITFNTFTIKQIGSVNKEHQCSGSHNGIIAIFQDKLENIFLFDVSRNKIVAEYAGLSMASDQDASLYHCNCGGFTDKYYDKSDEMPLFMVSQRNMTSGTYIGRGLIQLVRIQPQRDDENEIIGMTADVVKSIYLPEYSSGNGLQYPNCTYDNGVIYSVSRYKEEGKTEISRVSKFNFPTSTQKVDVLNNADILESFDVDFRPLNTQSCILKNGKIYCMRGGNSEDPAVLCSIDTSKKQIATLIELSANGFVGEPEGVFFMAGKMHITTNGGRIMELSF